MTRDFGTGTRGFSAAEDLGLAVCVMPGTELAFAGEVACLPTGLLGQKTKTIHRTAIFRQVNKDKSAAITTMRACAPFFSPNFQMGGPCC